MGTNERLLRLPEVVQITGLSRMTVYRRMQDGTFPQSRRISPNIVAWHAAEVADWMRGIFDERAA